MALHPVFPNLHTKSLTLQCVGSQIKHYCWVWNTECYSRPLCKRSGSKSKRGAIYKGASETSKALLNWWFKTPHARTDCEFQYYFAQREALETIIYLYDVVKVKDEVDMIRFDSSRAVSTGMFDETGDAL